MIRCIVVLATLSALALAGCGQTPAQVSSEVATGVAAARTLADIAAQYNTTAANLVAQGNLICGQVDSTTGQLIAGTVEAVATVAGAPASVTGATASTVAAACPAGTAPGPLPASVTAAQIPVVVTDAATLLAAAAHP